MIFFFNKENKKKFIYYEFIYEQGYMRSCLFLP